MAGDRDEAAEARRRARQACEVRIVRPGDDEAEADASALDWARTRLDERAEVVGRLCVERCRLAAQGSTADAGHPLPRAETPWRRRR
ncbi:MAG TPA: hypothetical protein VFS43_04785 [Polyangiaceae bacterium]|nr:hypothetical protein [Polyangiaceae bacterium]